MDRSCAGWVEGDKSDAPVCSGLVVKRLMVRYHTREICNQSVSHESYEDKAVAYRTTCVGGLQIRVLKPMIHLPLGVFRFLQAKLLGFTNSHLLSLHGLTHVRETNR